MFGKFMNFLSFASATPKFLSVGIRGAHSYSKIIRMSDMHVHVLPALRDNYMYMIVDVATKQAALVDPVDADAALKVVRDEKVNLRKILTTHYHSDHSGGKAKLVEKFPMQPEVLGGSSRIPAITKCVKHRHKFKIGNLMGECYSISTPCHTTDSMCYYVKSPRGEKAVFTGDTLFQAGCGRFSEGTAEQMSSALYRELRCIPCDTKVFFGHEYTLDNLCYARHVEPKNKYILQRLEWAKYRRRNKLPTAPSTISMEELSNPFMRVHIKTVQKHAGKTKPIETMGALRKERDDFKAKPFFPLSQAWQRGYDLRAKIYRNLLGPFSRASSYVRSVLLTSYDLIL